MVRKLFAADEASLACAVKRDTPWCGGRIEEMLEQSGLRALTVLSEGDEVQQCLRRFAVLVQAEDPLTQNVARSAGIEILKRIDFQAPARAVDSAFKGAGTSERSGENGRATIVVDVDPWPEVVELSSLLDELQATFLRYVAMDESEALAAALWTVHTYCLDATDVTPRLAILSPTKRCGKTTFLALLGALVRRSLMAANISAAAVFRVVERDHPTLLIDEGDTFIQNNEDLRGILNAGHTRGSCVIRCESVDHGFEPVAFDTWGAVAIAMIGKLPATLADRSITIQLRRKTTRDDVARLKRRELRLLTPLAQRCRRWAIDNELELEALTPPELEGLDSRAEDNWEPLLNIAQRAGPSWLQRAKDSAQWLTRRVRTREREDDHSERLLSDIKSLVEDGQLGERFTLQHLTSKLRSIADAPWPHVENGRPLTAHFLARLLRTFDIQPKSIRFPGNAVHKGYQLASFIEAFARYLPETSVTAVTSVETLENSSGEPQLHLPPVTPPALQHSLNGSALVTAVTAQGLRLRPNTNAEPEPA